MENLTKKRLIKLKEAKEQYDSIDVKNVIQRR